MALRVGLRLPQYGGTWDELRATARLAESLGFDGLWLNDHLQSPGRLKDEPTFEAFTTLSALASLTTTARLGIVVMSASYRPAALAAKMAGVLDVISGGRLVLGLGTGSDRAEHRAYGFPFATPAARTAGLRSTLDVIHAMARHPSGATVPGAIEGAPNRPQEPHRPHPPIWLGAHRPGLLRLAGQRADGVVAAFLSPDELAARHTIAEEARQAAGRGPISYALYTYALPVPSRAEAEAWVTPEATALGTSPARLLRWLSTTGLVASADELRARLADFAAAGATDAILVLPSRAPPDAVHALAEAVLPEGGPPSARRPASGRVQDNLVHLLVDRHREAGRGGGLAAVDPSGSSTFDELSAAARRAAGALREAGVRRGERVAVLLPDGRPWLAAFLGAAALGAVACPLDPTMPPDRLAQVLADLEPTIACCEADRELPGRPARVGPAELDGGDALPVAAVHPEDLAYMIHSSGSTGRPKGAMHAHRDLRVGIDGYAAQVLGLGPGDRCHSVAKLFTSLGFGNGFFRALGCGAACVYSPLRPTVRSVVSLVARERVSVLTAVPTFWAQLASFLARHPDPDALAAVRLAVSSGDSLPPAVAGGIEDQTGLRILEGLGCSECSTIVLSTRAGEPLPGTLGRVAPGVEVRLADADGRPVGEGEPGRLWIRSPSNTFGYWRRGDETRDVVLGEWVRMGDVLSQEGGVYRHLGRVDDLFKVDAKWVSPVEVEGVLHEHSAVADVAVVGQPDASGLVRAVAVIVREEAGADDAALAEELRRYVAHRLEPHKAPAQVVFVRDMPRLASGKVDRRGLRTGTGSSDSMS